MSTDQITRTVILRASRERVWHAISDAAQFGTWFGVELNGAFAAGEEATGRIARTQVDAEVAKLQEPHRGAPFRVRVEEIEPMRVFSFRWHPFAVEPGRDYGDEPTTLVRFELADAEGDGVRLTITESGFDALPEARRAAARRANDGGWEHQSQLIARYLDDRA